MSTDPQRALGLDDDDVVPITARPGQDADPTPDPDAVPFERGRHPRDRRPAGPSSAALVAGDSPRDLDQESVAAQATHTPAPTPSIPYEPTTASGRAAKRRVGQVDAMHDETRETAELLYGEGAEPRGRRRASPVALIAIAAICATLALLAVTAIHGRMAAHASANTRGGALAMTKPPVVDPARRPQRRGAHHRSSARRGLVRTRVRTRTVVIVERAPAANATRAAAPAAVSAPAVATVAAPACVPGDLGC